MKKILIGLAFFFCFSQAFGQSNDTTLYIYYRFTYGNALDRYYAKHVLMIPNDTIYSKDGLAFKNGTLYTGNGIKWTAVGTGGGSAFDSLTSQGGGFHTLPYNDLRYRGIIDTLYTHYLMTRDWAYKMRDSTAGVTNAALAGKQPTGNYITSLNTDVVTSGFSGGAAVATIQAHAVTNAKSAQMAGRTVKANITGAASDPVDVPIDSLASHITPDSVRIYRKPGSDSVFLCVTPVATGVEKCTFQYHDSIGTGGGTSINTVKKIITQASHPFTANEPIYLDTTSTTWHAADTTNFAMAVVDSVIGTNSFEATFAGTYNATAHGLSTGKYYYVTMPAGSITPFPPVKNQPVLIPIDANTILVNIHRPVDFSGATSGGSALSVGSFSSSSQPQGATVSSSVITFGPADATNPGMIKPSGNQTLGDSLTIPGLSLTNLTSAGVNDSTLTIDPSTKRVHWKTASASGSTPTLQQVYNTQVGGSQQTKPDTVLLTGGNYLRLKGGQVFMDTVTVGNATHTATQGFQVANGLYTNFINTDLNTAAGTPSTMEVKQLNMNPASTQPFKFEFQNGGVNTFNAKLTGNGNNTLGTQYFDLGINSSNIATPVSAYTGFDAHFDARLLPGLKMFIKYAGATADSLAMLIDTNAAVCIGSLGQVIGAGLLQSASQTRPQLGLIYNSANKALLKVGSTGSLDISALTGLTIASSALPTGSSSDSVMVISGNTVKKVLQSSIGSSSPLIFSETAAGTAVTNTTTSTTIIGTGTGSQTVAANTLTVGKTISMHGWLTMTTGATNTNGTIYAYNSTGGIGISTSWPANLSGSPGEINIIGTILTTGSGGTMSLMGTLTVGGSQVLICSAPTGTTINTTIAQTFDVQMQWTTATSANSINMYPLFTIKVQ